MKLKFHVHSDFSFNFWYFLQCPACGSCAAVGCSEAAALHSLSRVLPLPRPTSLVWKRFAFLYLCKWAGFTKGKLISLKSLVLWSLEFLFLYQFYDFLISTGMLRVSWMVMQFYQFFNNLQIDIVSELWVSIESIYLWIYSVPFHPSIAFKLP